MAIKIVLTSCFPCLLDCWYLLHCFPVIFFCLSDWSEISFRFLSLFNVVYRACSGCRYSSLLGGSVSRRCRYSRWCSAFVFPIICKNMVYVKMYSYKTSYSYNNKMSCTVTRHLILIIILKEPTRNDGYLNVSTVTYSV